MAHLIKELRMTTHPHHTLGDAMYHDGAESQRLQGNPIDVESDRFSHSAASLTDALAAELAPGTTRLSTAVTAIGTSGDGAVVQYTGGVVACKHVVLAVPPALVMHAIKFDPPLPEKVSAVAARTPVWMGAIAKAVVVYDKPFWRRQGLAGAAMSRTGPLLEVHDMSGPGGEPAALFGFARVPRGAAPPTKQAVKKQMVEIFGAEAGAPREVVVQDWLSLIHI